MVNSVDMSIDFSYAWKTPTHTLFESGILVSTFDYVFC